MLDDGSLPCFEVCQSTADFLELSFNAILATLKFFQVFKNDVFHVFHADEFTLDRSSAGHSTGAADWITPTPSLSRAMSALRIAWEYSRGSQVAGCPVMGGRFPPSSSALQRNTKYAAMQYSSPANTFLRGAMSMLCATRAPSGAVAMLAIDITSSPGQKT